MTEIFIHPFALDAEPDVSNASYLLSNLKGTICMCCGVRDTSQWRKGPELRPICSPKIDQIYMTHRDEYNLSLPPSLISNSGKPSLDTIPWNEVTAGIAPDMCNACGIRYTRMSLRQSKSKNT